MLLLAAGQQPRIHMFQQQRRREQQKRRSDGGSGNVVASATRTTQGTLDTAIPNLFYRSMHHDALRLEDSYVALPQEPVLSGPESLRYVRQGSETWRAAHGGRITTGSLLALLGWRHEKAASRLGLSAGMRGNEHLPAAYNALLAGPDADLAAALAAGSDDGGSSGEVANEAARVAYNAALRGADPPLTCAATRREISARAAAAGELSVRLAFGKVQEHAALYSLARIYPASVLEEAGLFVPSDAQLRGSFSPSGHSIEGSSGGADEAAVPVTLLPQVGASPDAIICHELRFSYAEVRRASQLLAEGRRREAAGALLRVGLARVPCAAPPASSVASSSGSATSSSSGGGGGASAAREQPALSPCDALSGPSVEERLIAFIEAAASDGFEQQQDDSSSNQTADAEEQQQQQLLYPQTLWVREVVEVKTHCPFACRARRRGHKGRLTLGYAVRASCAPVARAAPGWVPQLQLHMLCTGCMSALLVSRAPHAGVRAFRVYRDDEFLAHVLSILSGLAANVAAGRPAPKATVHLATPAQAAALACARAIAVGAEVAAELEFGSGGAGADEDEGRDAAAVLLPPRAHDASNVAAFWT